MALLSPAGVEHLLLQLKQPTAREHAAQEILSQVLYAHRELQTDVFSDFFNTLTNRIGNSILSQDPNERIGGILALEQLLSFHGADDAQKTSQYHNKLTAALRSNDNEVLVYASRAMGKLATPGAPFIAELVDSEVKQALEFLMVERNEARRFSAVLVLRELARTSPTLLFAYVPQILEYIWPALRDLKVLIRETAADAVKECFAILTARDTRVRSQWFQSAWNEACISIKQNSVEYIHGGLLVIRELVRAGGMFMNDHFTEACQIAADHKAHKEIRIRAEIVGMIPLLAGYAPQNFTKHWCGVFMPFLLSQLKKDKERSQSFLAIGEVALALKHNIQKYLDSILLSIREGLGHKVKSRSKDGSVFICISKLCVALGQVLTKYMDALLDPMFACGLSPSLTQALSDMAHYVQPVKGAVQDKLLNLISLVLCGRAFKPLGCPDNRLPPTPNFARDWQQHGIYHGDAEVAYALNTLGSFDFKGHVLNEFVRDVALRFVKNPSPEIRKAAALTCCNIYEHDPIIKQTSLHAIAVVRLVISELLSAAIGDPVADIRRTILLALDAKFDRYLAEQDNIRKIIMAVNESDYEVRKAAMAILGRLVGVNPAYVFPPLRKLLQNFTMSIHASKDPIYEEEGAQLISLFVKHTSELVKPFVETLVKTFLPKATDTNPAVAAAVIAAIGDLSTLGGSDMKKFVPQLMPIIIDALQDLSAPDKRDSALIALGKLASSSGYVIDPYLDYPQLLPLLTNIIKIEPQGNVKTHSIRLLGVLGALDPYRHQQALEAVSESKPDDVQRTTDVDLIMNGTTPSSDDYFPSVVMHTLMNNVLRDNSLAQYHHAVVEAIVSIFKTLGLKCVNFLPQIIPIFITVITAQPGRQELYFSQLAILVSIVREHIRPFRTDLVKLVKDCWAMNPKAQSSALRLVEALSRALHREFYPSIVDLLPLLLSVFDSNATSDDTCNRVLHTILIFGQDAEQAMWFILPKLVRTFASLQRSVEVRKSCISTIGNIARQTNISDYSALLMHNLGDMLSSSDLRSAAYDTIVTLIFQFPLDVEPFLDGVNMALKTNKVAGTQLFDQLYSKLRAGQTLPQDLRASPQLRTVGEDVDFAETGQRNLTVNQEHLKHAWNSSQQTTREDWLEWMRRFSLELLKESPSNALRACANLAATYQPLAKDLFNAAFVSCYVQLYEQYQDELVRSLERALTSPQIPPEILQTLLNLAEFMEHDDKPLPIDIGTLGKHAYYCHAYAKALHYKELEFEEDKTSSVIEALISINNQLQQGDAANGILRLAQKYPDFTTQESWYEKLGQWDDALSRYQERERRELQNGGPVSFDVSYGKMRCYHAVGEWEELAGLAQEKWSLASIDQKRLMAPLAAAASWGLSQWEHMDNYIEAMKAHSPDRSFFGAIRSLQQDQYTDAEDHIEKARSGLDTELGPLLGESYTRAYSVVVRVQMLAELEEIIAYKKAEKALDTVRQATMRETWKTRLMGCEGNVETWERMLKVRALVLTPRENMDLWIKFANLCRKSNRLSLAQKSLQAVNDSHVLFTAQGDGLEDSEHSLLPTIIPEVQYAQLKYDWTVSGNDHGRAAALNGLRDFAGRLSEYCHGLEISFQQSEQHPPNPMNVFAQGWPAEMKERKASIARTKLLLSKSYLRYGRWVTHELRGDWKNNPQQVREILSAYKAAAQYNSEGYKAWHAWALANFEVISAMTGQMGQEHVPIPQQTIEAHVIPAVTGFFKSISLSTSKSTLQDTLRLLTLWFAHGGNEKVLSALKDGFRIVNMDTWLEAIPQLIARINQPNLNVRRAVHNLLCDVGKLHPQALVYPLTVAMKSDVRGRSESAKAVMEQLRTRDPELVEQAQLVSKELIRSAVLWHEQWHEGLEEASRLYFGPDRNPEAMFATLAPLHKQLDDGPETLREISFAHAFGRELSEARHWCGRFRETQDPGDINQAWDLYYGVFRRITKQLQQLIILDLKYISPALGEARDLVLAVPGTYKSGKPVIRIQSFDKVFNVIPSKQRPRKMTLRGSDGLPYTYCLKGHEDIRQDERVMQLFGLVNTLLNDDSEAFKRHLNIQRFSATPLSQNSGVIGWVPNSDTLHNLIKEYRDNRKILLNIEHRIMLQMAPDYDALTLMQKVEVFQYAMDNTTGKDLYRVLWLKSRSSEAWLERRTNYTRSLAVMSMVGYILGLGDRHPSNLMLDRNTGKIVHIDFGDCFEIAMQREKYPERVPFRLTRMLTYAMEVSNIDGSYKASSINVMRVIRENKESLMAVLEAFIHDPLLNWRLTARESPMERTSFVSERRQSLIGGERPDPNVTVMGSHVAAGVAGSSLRDLEAAQVSNISGNIPAVQNSFRRPRAGTASGAGPNGVTPPLQGQQGAMQNGVLQNGTHHQQQQQPQQQQQQQQQQGGAGAAGGGTENREQQNARAVQVLARVKDKLNGRDFMTDKERDEERRNGPAAVEAKELDVEQQVDRLIVQATSVENICQHYIGWCSFW